MALYLGSNKVNYTSNSIVDTIDSGWLERTLSIYNEPLLSVRSYMFAGMSSLSLPENSLSECSFVGQYAFAGCSKLSYITMLNPEIHLDDYAFANCGCWGGIQCYASVIPIGCFYYASGIQVLNIFNASIVKSYAFYGTNARTVRFDSNIQLIEDYAFAGYTSDFYNMVFSQISSVPTLGSMVFVGNTRFLSSGRIYVPSGLINEFQTAPNWSSVSSRIMGE